jgi:hypothetical protein
LVIPDQILDRTSGRAHTYMDADNGVFHVAYADPYCPVGRACALAAGGVTGLPVQPAATMVVVNGPRFSTRAESQEFQRAGAAIIGMTGMPEAGLARELALCYTTLTLVTDLDAGIEIGSGVTQTEVFEQFAANVPRLRTLLVATIEQLPPGQTELRECGRVRRGPAAVPAAVSARVEATVVDAALAGVTWSVTWPLRSGWASVSRTFRPTHRSTTMARPSVRVRRCRSRDLPRGGPVGAPSAQFPAQGARPLPGDAP